MKKIPLYLALLAIVYLLTFMINLPDYDLWARLAVGSIFFQTGHVLKHDIFSYLPTKDLWIDHEWGAGVIFYFFTKYLGNGGLFVLKAVTILAIFILIIKTIKMCAGHKDVGVFYLVFIGFSLFPGMANLIRCQLFTYFFFTLWIFLLEKVRRGENRMTWIFPATMLLWANMHGGFLAGIGLVMIYALGERFNRNYSWKYVGILALIVPVTLINPYGIHLWTYMAEAAFMPRPHIAEWSSINLSGPVHIIAGVKIHVLVGFAILVLMTLFAGVRLWHQKIKPDWTKIILISVLLFLSMRHQRHTEFFMLAAAGLLYHHYVDLFRSLDQCITARLLPTSLRLWKSIQWSFGYILLGIILVYVSPKISHTVIVSPFSYPVGSIEFIRLNGISGNLATTYEWGSYAFWKLYPQCKVLIDGRYEEVYHNATYIKAMQFSKRKENWQEIIKNYSTDILVLPKNTYSKEDMLSLTDWIPVYEDRISVLLLPKSAKKFIYFHPSNDSLLFWEENLSRGIRLN